MRTYRDGTGGRGLALLALVVCVASPLVAQERRYLAEIGAAGVYQSFDGLAGLKSAPGFLLRGGLWLPLNFSVEGEAAFATPKAKADDIGTSYRALFLSLLYNIPVGRSNWFYLKGGGGSNSYAGNRYDECPPPGGDTPIANTACGRSGVLSGGGGFRIGLTPTLLARGEAIISGYKSHC